MKNMIFLIFVLFILIISSTPVLADADSVDVLFSANNTKAMNNLSSNETVAIANETVTNNNITANNTNNTNNISYDNFKEFKKEWYSTVQQTQYERYSGHEKTIKQIKEDNSFNCYDGAYYTGYLANKHGLDYKIVHGYWDGIGHGAVRVYKKDGTYELFDTTQYQKGYGRNGLENSIYWDKIDYYSTKDSKKENKAVLMNETNGNYIVPDEQLGFDNILNNDDLQVDLSCDLSVDLSINPLAIFLGVVYS